MFGSAPVVVLAADAAGVRSDFADLPKQLRVTLYRIVKDGYQTYLLEATDGKFEVVPGSSHGVGQDSPDSVVRAVELFLSGSAR